MVNRNICHVLILEIGSYGENDVNQGVLKLARAPDSPGGLDETWVIGHTPRIAGWRPNTCISKQVPAETDAAGPQDLTLGTTDVKHSGGFVLGVLDACKLNSQRKLGFIYGR